MDIDMEEKAPLDLEAYAANYRGQMRVQRLQQVARTSNSLPLKSDALRMAYSEVKQNTQNVELLLKICQLAKEAGVQGCDEDHTWCHTAVSESDALKKRLEADLNAAKANNIRESIRQSSMDLGMYFFDRSDFVSASKMFMRTRDHCSNNVQMLDFCIAVIKTYVLTQNWPMVSTYVGKAEGILADPKSDRQKQVQAQMHAVSGLADLSLSRYRQAALSFSRVGSELGSSFDDVVASVDVARYGVLTALATHDRTAIRAQFLNSPTFSTHLECMLEARELLEAICTSRFVEAFRILDDMRPALQMDPFLFNHLTRLTHQIRCRVLQQYTKPFQSLRLSDMAQALGCKLDDLELELARLIADDMINARIDSHNKVLYRKMTDERSCTINAVVKAVDDYIANAHSLLLRAELAKCNLRPTGGVDAMGSVDIDFDGAHEGISAEIGGFPSSMMVESVGFPTAPAGLGR